MKLALVNQTAFPFCGSCKLADRVVCLIADSFSQNMTTSERPCCLHATYLLRHNLKTFARHRTTYYRQSISLQPSERNTTILGLNILQTLKMHFTLQVYPSPFGKVEQRSWLATTTETCSNFSNTSRRLYTNDYGVFLTKNILSIPS